MEHTYIVAFIVADLIRYLLCCSSRYCPQATLATSPGGAFLHLSVRRVSCVCIHPSPAASATREKFRYPFKTISLLFSCYHASSSLYVLSEINSMMLFDSITLAAILKHDKITVSPEAYYVLLKRTLSDTHKKAVDADDWPNHENWIIF